MLNFDYAATAPIDTKALKQTLDRIDEGLFGNPSSNHILGIKSKQLLEEARERVATCLNCDPDNIYFTSGGSESDNWALKGFMTQVPKEFELITSTIEHPAILNTCKELWRQGYNIKYVKPNSKGYIEPKEVEKLITDKTLMISIMAVNNEIGTIEPINEIAEIAHKHNIIFHSDMVQGMGLYDIDLSNINMASFSGHKFGSIKGTGILYCKGTPINPLIHGGGQEDGFRSGTENVFGALNMSYALEHTLNKWSPEYRNSVRKYLENIKNKLYENFHDKVYLISNELSVPNCLSIGFKNVDSKTLQLMLSQKDILVSVGSACHSKSDDISHVIKEINVPTQYQNGVIRITSSPQNCKADFDILLDNLIAILKYLYESEEK